MSKKYYNNFSWRTAPRSIRVLLEWLPYFNNVQGQQWDYKVSNGNRTIYPVRRKLRWEYEQNVEEINPGVADVSYEDFVAGQQNNTKDLESLVRQQFTTGEQYGFMSLIEDIEGKKNTLYISEAGKRVVEGTFTAEDFLVQLLKMYVIVNDNEEGIFPLELFIRLLDKFEYLSRMELTFMFATTTPDKFEKVVESIEEFRACYNNKDIIPNKNDTKKIEDLIKNIWSKKFGEGTFLNSWKDYTDAFLRAVTYTSMFITSGRSIYTKVRVHENYSKKFELLLSRFKFQKPASKREEKDGEEVYIPVSSREDIYWFGAVGNIPLPWDNFEDRKTIVIEAKEKLEKLFEFSNNQEKIKHIKELGETISSTSSITDLKDIEKNISDEILAYNIDFYIEKTSKDPIEIKNVIDRFNLILDDNDMSALWLEVNTWKSFICIGGANKVIPNFKMESDLTPRAFAPGIGNTPDMEVYSDEFVIVPEVSLMTGKVQWEHEASSVIDHVINISNKNPDKDVIGLFISSNINYRTFWQFFVLSKTSWMEKPVPVIPLTITQYSNLFKKFIDENKSVDDLYQILKEVSNKAVEVNDYKQWQSYINEKLWD